jgi:hypothetical protein
MIREHEPLRVRPVVRDVRALVGDVGRVVEAIHRATVDRGDPVGEAVAVVGLSIDGTLERNGGAVTLRALGRSIGPREPREQVVERPVLLRQEDDVIDVRPGCGDLLRRRPRPRGRRGHLGRFEVFGDRPGGTGARWRRSGLPEHARGERCRQQERGADPFAKLGVPEGSSATSGGGYRKPSRAEPPV